MKIIRKLDDENDCVFLSENNFYKQPLQYYITVSVQHDTFPLKIHRGGTDILLHLSITASQRKAFGSPEPP